MTREMVQRYQRHLYYYRKRNGQPLALSSQTHWLVGLRGWFRWLRRYLEVDPAAHLELPRDEQCLPRHPLSPSEAEAILAQPDTATPLGLRDRADPGDALLDRPAPRGSAAAGPLGPGPRAEHGLGPLRQGAQGPLRADRCAGHRLDQQVPGPGAL